ncbi:unnamed protein product [Trypanosoma congolense IL3000]|uniref:WGS project CAEQ00000000 data, annotated contig 1172 n=1 Tax=Trypanosoma congolense (strain IL3000) TaxID=1068625 RepID=F9W4D3_TRYCI|nr:unnamed protein product [Trypanosoma congolense IL3000]
MSPGEGTCISISIYIYIYMHVLLCKYNGNNIFLLFFSPFFSQYNFCASFSHFHFFLCFCSCRYRGTLVSATHGSVRGPGVLHAVDERVLTPSKRCPPARVELPKGVFFLCVGRDVVSFSFVPYCIARGIVRHPVRGYKRGALWTKRCGSLACDRYCWCSRGYRSASSLRRP